MTNQYTWRQERQMLEDSYARRLLVEHNIKEVTTQRQAKNGTREFEFPVPCYSKQRLEWFKYKKYNLKDLPRLRLATFESGMIIPSAVVDPLCRASYHIAATQLIDTSIQLNVSPNASIR